MEISKVGDQSNKKGCFCLALIVVATGARSVVLIMVLGH